MHLEKKKKKVVRHELIVLRQQGPMRTPDPLSIPSARFTTRTFLSAKLPLPSSPPHQLSNKLEDSLISSPLLYNLGSAFSAIVTL